MCHIICEVCHIICEVCQLVCESERIGTERKCDGQSPARVGQGTAARLNLITLITQQTVIYALNPHRGVRQLPDSDRPGPGAAAQEFCVRPSHRDFDSLSVRQSVTGHRCGAERCGVCGAAQDARKCTIVYQTNVDGIF